MEIIIWYYYYYSHFNKSKGVGIKEGIEESMESRKGIIECLKDSVEEAKNLPKVEFNSIEDNYDFEEYIESSLDTIINFSSLSSKDDMVDIISTTILSYINNNDINISNPLYEMPVETIEFVGSTFHFICVGSFVFFLLGPAASIGTASAYASSSVVNYVFIWLGYQPSLYIDLTCYAIGSIAGINAMTLFKKYINSNDDKADDNTDTDIDIE